MKVEIYTDGSAKNNGAKENCGGWGVVGLIEDQSCKSGFRIDYTISKQEENTTNNRMELTALIFALAATQTRYKNDKCIIKSDSAYCVNMFNDWIYNWQRNGWVRQKNQPIENLDLVKQIWEYCKLEWPNFTVEKVPGHSGLLGNELADALSTNNQTKIDKILKENDNFYEKVENFDLQ